MKRVLFVLLGLLIGCGGGKTPSGPTTPTPSATPVNIAGTYSLTVTASGVCGTLPSFGQSRTWTVAVTQSGSNMAAAFSGGNFTVAQLSGTVQGNRLDFLFLMLEQLTVGGNFSLYTIPAGSGSATITSPSSFSGELSGTIETSQVIGTTLQERTCNAVNHRFTFTRR
jgi:hypothetical protein